MAKVVKTGSSITKILLRILLQLLLLLRLLLLSLYAKNLLVGYFHSVVFVVFVIWLVNVTSELLCCLIDWCHDTIS